MPDYDAIAFSYDKFTKAFDYGDYLEKILSEIDKKPLGTLALDCGCGTGNLLELLVKNFDCTGVDVSEEMLFEASSKPSLSNVNFVCQPLEELDLYGAYDYVFCSLDTLNHLTAKRSLKAFFKRIANFTEPGGVFIFDLKTLDKLKKNAKTAVYEEGNDLLIWEAFWQKPYISHRLTVFSQEQNGLYKKEETQIDERYYSKEEIKELMSKLSPLKLEKTFSYKNERTVFIYRKK